MAWVIGKKSDHTIIEVSNNSAFTLASCETIFPQKFGGVKEDYYFLEITESEYNNYADGASHEFVWTGDNLTSIDFSIEESKPWVKLSSNKTSIENDGIDYATITLEVWKPDLSEIDTSITLTDRRVPIITPKGVRYVRFDIVNGTATANFRSIDSGTYKFPSTPKRFGSMRIYNQINIEVDETSLLEVI